MSLQTIINALSSLGKFWQQKINAQILRWNVVLIAFQLLLLLLKFNRLPQFVPLYYSLPWGSSQLASASLLFFLPSVSILILITNSLLSVVFLESLTFLSRLLLIFSLLFSFLGFVSLFQIINLVS